MRFARNAAFLFAAALAPAAQAQYSVAWHTIDAGGGVSSGGNYTLAGSIGQAEVDVVPICSPDGGVACINPVYQIESGFWVGFAQTACTGQLNCLFRDGFEPSDAE